MKKDEIKTLANCTDIEFLKQANKVRNALEELFTVTDIANIRKRMPELEKIDPDMDEEKKLLIKEKNNQLIRDQINKNMADILDSLLEEHPEETLKVIRLCCFVEPDDNSHKVSYYLGAFSQMLSNKDVIDFFTSLVNLGQTFGFKL